MPCKRETGKSTSSLSSFALSVAPQSRRSRRELSPLAGNLDPPGDDLLLDLLEPRPHGVGDEGAVVLVVDVADAALLEAKGVDAALEGAVLHALDHVVSRVVDALHHRRQHVARRLGVLVGVDADAVLAGGARRLEDAESRRARGVEDDVDALLELAEGELL